MTQCIVEGCKSTTLRYEGQWICVKHWRAHVPPRGMLRRAYHAHHRRGKRLGWPMPLRDKYWRFWDALVRRANRREAEGAIDEKAINALFGWE